MGGAFGHSASVMYGGELGFRLTERLGFFAQGVWLRSVTTANLETSAATAEQGIQRLPGVLSSDRPDALLLLDGVNDLNRARLEEAQDVRPVQQPLSFVHNGFRK